MKIHVIGTRGFPGVQGGVERHGQELYPRLAQRGHDVTVYARSPYFPPDRRPDRWCGVKFAYLWAPRSLYFEAILHSLAAALRAVRQRREIDVVHVHNIGPALCLPLLKLAGLRTVLTYHSPNYEHPKWGPLARAVLRFGERVGVRFSDRIISVTAAGKRRLEKAYRRAPVIHIPNGVARMEIVPPGATLARWGLSPRKYFFTACRWVEGKGLPDLIEAFRRLGRSDLKLVIAGCADHETPYSRRVRDQAAATPGVVLPGFVTGPPLVELYSHAGLFVLPSYSEGLPLSLLEALACRTPVLASDIEAHREVALADYRYYPVGNIDALAEKMRELIGQEDTAEESQAYSRMLVEQYDWDHVAQKTCEVLDALSRDLGPAKKN